MLNGKVNSYITDLIRSGALSGSDAAAIASMSSSSSLSSLSNINGLPADVQSVVREAFRQGSRFAFISLVPWAALAAVAALFLTNIREDRPRAKEISSETTARPGMEREEAKMEEVKRSPQMDEVRYDSSA